MWTRKQLIKAYLDFFKSKKHEIIGNASLIPENDPSVLFTTAGMHPLVPYLMGQLHPSGKRLANVQRCIRTGDIDEVGDEFHHTFFEMLGNWSLGDYFKEDAIKYSFEFLTKTLKLPISMIAVTVFAGDRDSKKDDEAAKIWLNLGIPKEKIAYMPKENNWWGPAGTIGPCGPDTEMFYYVGKDKPSKNSNPSTEPNKWCEIWNDVFMQYDKRKDGSFAELKAKNVDTGMGVERTLTVLDGLKDDYQTETFLPIINELELMSKLDYGSNAKRSMRIISDHLRAAVFILGDPLHITPSNTDQGYVLRRLIRKSIRHGKLIGIESEFCKKLAKLIIDMFMDDYPELEKNRNFILGQLNNEETRFRQTLDKGLREFDKIAKSSKKLIDAKDAFMLYQSYGFPIEMITELANERNIKVDEEGFMKEYEKHQEVSRVGAEKKFKGGLGEISEITTKMHTTTHLLNEALRKIIDPKIYQMGSNITPERLRFDFKYDKKLTPEQIKAVEDEVNRVINLDLKVTKKEMTLEEAKKIGAQAQFGEKYAEKVYVYSIGDYSREVCGGPHVERTKQVGKFKIVKEEASSAGVRRIRAVLE